MIIEETYVLHVTKKCNMKCAYCYERDKESEYEWSDIKIILDDIVKYNKHFNLEFLGGEPCLRIDLIGLTIGYLESKPDVTVGRYSITTNGTIINKELIDILKQYPHVDWVASIDGNKIMNTMRVLKDNTNGHDIVVENFKVLRDALDGDHNDQLGCHMVTHHYNIAYFNDGITHLYDIGFRNFGIGTVESIMEIDDRYCEEFVRQHKILSDRLHKGELSGIMIGLFEGVKPPTDERHYIRDETGKVVLETYGRAENDILTDEVYRTEPSSSPIGDTIYRIRKEVYDYHNR